MPIVCQFLILELKSLNTTKDLYCFYCGAGLDPCQSSSVNCSENAYCIPTDNTYRCECKTGFYGDGYSCEGKSLYSYLKLL